MKLAHVLSLGLVIAAGSAAGADPESGCVVEMQTPDRGGIATVHAECHWPIPHERVAGVIVDRDRLAEVMLRVSHNEVLGDGRILQVHSLGWGFADRQVTITDHIEALDDGGVRIEFRRADEQAPLVEGRVQILVDEGWWEIRPEEGGTLLRYGLRYDPGGNLKPWLVRRFQSSGVEQSLEDVRRAAER